MHTDQAVWSPYLFKTMEFVFFFSLAGVIIVSLILKFYKKQSRKIKAVLKETRGVPPLFMLKSTERKIAVLKTALRYDDVPNMAGAAESTGYDTTSESNRLSKVQELKLLSSKYNNGLISIEAYNAKLDELLDQVQSQGGSFELAC
jgi:hypothetical protein